MYVDPDPSGIKPHMLFMGNLFSCKHLFYIKNKARESFPADALYVERRLCLNRLLFQVLIGLITSCL